MDWKYLLLAIAAAWGLQAILTGIQMQNYRKRFSAIAKLAQDGYLGVGSSTGRITPGAVVLLATDSSGNVLAAERMRGWTVFARFEELSEIIGESIHDLAGEESDIPIADKKTRKAVRMAAELLVKKMASQEESSELDADPSEETEVASGA